MQWQRNAMVHNHSAEIYLFRGEKKYVTSVENFLRSLPDPPAFEQTQGPPEWLLTPNQTLATSCTRAETWGWFAQLMPGVVAVYAC